MAPIPAIAAPSQPPLLAQQFTLEPNRRRVHKGRGKRGADMSNEAIEDGGAAVAATLREHGVSLLFTLCGGHISPILVAAKKLGIRVIDVRQEATAVFAADAVARLTGSPGVAAVTAGPGVTNSVTPLKNALLSQSPMLLIGGAAPSLLQGRGALQDIDQRAVVSPNVKTFRRAKRVRDLGSRVAETWSEMLEGVQGPGFVECAVDQLYAGRLVRQWYADAAGKGTSLPARARRWYVMRHFAKSFAGADSMTAAPRRPVAWPVAADSDIAAAVEALSKAERPLAIIGGQALAAGTDANRVAEAVRKLGVPVYLSSLARGLLGRESAVQMMHNRRQALREADCVLLAGTPCDFRLEYGQQISSKAKFIALNRSAKDARLNRKPDIAVIGDVGAALQALAARGGDASRWKEWIDRLHVRDGEKEVEIAKMAAAEGEFVNPVALLKAIDAAAADEAIFCADGGDFVATASYVLRPRGPRMWLDPGPFGTLGVGAGFGLAAALCRPEAETWIIFGDGACGYSLAEFDTFVRHRVPVIAVVGNDAAWTQIAREQVKMLGDDVAVTLARSDYHEVARAFGAVGLVLKSNADIPRVLAEAHAAAKAGKPVLINAWLDRTAFREGSISM